MEARVAEPSKEVMGLDYHAFDGTCEFEVSETTSVLFNSEVS